MICPADQGAVRRYYGNSRRYVACAACGADITDPDDYYADWTGMTVPNHDRIST